MPQQFDLPLLLAGPIVRRVEPALASVWVALSKPASISLKMIDLGKPLIGAKPVPAGDAREHLPVDNIRKKREQFPLTFDDYNDSIAQLEIEMLVEALPGLAVPGNAWQT